MGALLELYLDQFLVFTLVLTRVSGLVMTAPIFGSRTAPMQVRAFLALAIALVLTPVQAGTYVQDPGNLMNYLVIIGREAVIGLVLGFGVMILFTGLQLAGQIIGQMSGLSLADIFDPSFDTSVPVFARLLDLITLSVFVIIGGHRAVMQALLDTFAWMPPGSSYIGENVVSVLNDVTTQSFSLGIRAAAPAMVALMMSVLIMGLISRTLPQLNVLAFGFSFNSMVMLATLAISLGGAVWMFQDQAAVTLQAIQDSLTTGPSG